jgi:hypothetical protein
MKKQQAAPAFVSERDGGAGHLGVSLTLPIPLSAWRSGATRGASDDAISQN